MLGYAIIDDISIDRPVSMRLQMTIKFPITAKSSADIGKGRECIENIGGYA